MFAKGKMRTLGRTGPLWNGSVGPSVHGAEDIIVLSAAETEKNIRMRRWHKAYRQGPEFQVDIELDAIFTNGVPPATTPETPQTTEPLGDDHKFTAE